MSRIVSRTMSGDVDVGGGRDLARDVDLAGRDHRLDGDPAGRVVLDHRVEDRVADLVSDLVRVTLGHGLRGEQTARHGSSSWRCGRRDPRRQTRRSVEGSVAAPAYVRRSEHAAEPGQSWASTAYIARSTKPAGELLGFAAHALERHARVARRSRGCGGCRSRPAARAGAGPAGRTPASTIAATARVMTPRPVEALRPANSRSRRCGASRSIAKPDEAGELAVQPDRGVQTRLRRD